MSCCESTLPVDTQKKDNHHNPLSSDGPDTRVPSFSELCFLEFSPEYIISESSKRASNLVYKGRLQNCQSIAIKKFTKLASPNPKQFAHRCISPHSGSRHHRHRNLHHWL
ncbi:hypothetical protein CsSME_00046558 [Camellia sinensis var. sinensis]